MNKKGFTLVEMLAVIVILGILGTITIVSVKNIREKQNINNKENVISSILTGAKTYMANHVYLLDNSNFASISVGDLKKDDKYVSFDENDLNFSGLIDKTVEVKVCDENSNKLKYQIEVDGTIYDDCGCEEQFVESKEKSDKICKTNK